MKELWSYTGNRISVMFEYEWRDTDDNPNQRIRTQGNDHRECDNDSFMRIWHTSTNDFPIEESERHYR